MPEELITRCVINLLNAVHFLSLKSSCNLTLEEDSNTDFALHQLPFTAMLDEGKTIFVTVEKLFKYCSKDSIGTFVDVKFVFVQLTAILDTGLVKTELRPLLMLLSGLMFESPVIRNGQLIPFEIVVKELNRDLVEYDCGFGVSGMFDRFLVVTIKVCSMIISPSLSPFKSMTD